MEAIKSFSDLDQSKKLAEILPLESADMYYFRQIDNDYFPPDVESIYPIPLFKDGKEDFNYDIRCWSLAALLEQLPYELCDDDGNSSYLQINKEDDVYQLVYEDPYGNFESIETDRYEHFVDACVDMIIKLKGLNLL